MTPALSVVVATSSGWAPLERTIGCLAAQTVADRIELVVSAIGGPPQDEPPPTVAKLAAHRVVASPAARSVAEANAAGVRVATAPIIGFGEDHAFPLPGWAEALLARHEEDWACVGPVVRNANPGTAVSWADFAVGYGMYSEGQPGGAVAVAPGHNSTYKRAVLERHDADLEAALEAEWVFHLRLRDEGERICLEPRAILRHVNFGMFRPFATVTYRHALVASSVRARDWRLPKRLFYALATPLIPVVRFARLIRALPAQQRSQFPRTSWLILVLGLSIDAVGQAAGFFGVPPEDTRATLTPLELERLRFVPAAEAAGLP